MAPVTITAANLSGGNETKATAKKRHHATGTTSGTTASANGKHFSVGSSHRRHSHSNSSASSVVSGTGDPIDPYEFAVKTDDDEVNTCGINTTVAPMKRMKLDKVSTQ
ncbi:unnamed protein product [Echinostoma caproni]|uniref:Uncharacterized protein n=1 Tax=Echinostoma caproni TaxID=27848 RepID=A0A183AAM8_9TREM|nr:unnamed protein product [Echinostoma caproni]